VIVTIDQWKPTQPALPGFGDAALHCRLEDAVSGAGRNKRPYLLITLAVLSTPFVGKTIQIKLGPLNGPLVRQFFDALGIPTNIPFSVEADTLKGKLLVVETIGGDRITVYDRIHGFSRAPESACEGLSEFRPANMSKTERATDA
jgi:hypothetical protein